MIKVTDVVADLIKEDELALEALRADLLNLSAYAEKIHQRVENITFKDIKKGTIVVALSRIKNNLPEKESFNPEVVIKNLSLKSSLSAITYEKTADIQRKMAVLHPFLLPMNDLFSVTEGPSEVTLVCSEKSKDIILKHFGSKPKLEAENLVAITAEFDSKYIEVPNVLFTLMKSLANKRINLVEVISTLTEVSFVISQENMEQTMKILNAYFSKRH